jgi:carbonic anhydrase
VIEAKEALERLREGNARFVAGSSRRTVVTSQARLAELAGGQEPFAVVLGCSDSRVPGEIIFDQDLGDLFVIRVAGNIVAPSQVGSVEFAAAQFGTRLVVVLGHARCGAVQATLDELRHPNRDQSPNLRSITGRIRPAVQELMKAGRAEDPEALLRRAVRANVRASAHQLRSGSSILERLVREDGLLVVGAEYSLDTGVVEVFDGLP